MENEKLGKAISFLRKRAGYTQRELAELLDISDKAVSKWERGMSCPDISLLAKLSILLDTDIESLLQGNMLYCNQTWRGVIVFEDSKEISAGTLIYDKPMVYYFLSYFILVGIKDILVLCSLKNKNDIEKLLENGEKIGINLIYHVQDQIKGWEKLWRDSADFILGHNIMVLYGKKFLYGVDMTKIFQRAMSRKNGITLITTQKRCNIDTRRFVLDMNKKILLRKNGFQKRSQISYHTVPLFFCTSQLVQKIILNYNNFLSLSDFFKTNDVLYAEVLGRGIVQFDLNNWDELADVSTFVKFIQKNQREYIACIEEIAWRRGLITKKELKVLGDEKAETAYGDYILEIYNNE